MAGGSYREFAPPAELASHVACLWTRTDAPARVLPDGCIDVVWTGDRLILAGPATRAVAPQVPNGSEKVGVRFRVGAAAAVLGVPAAELRDLSPEWDDVLRTRRDVTARVADAPNARARLEILTAELRTRLAEADPPDPLVRAAVAELARTRTRVTALGQRLALSERQLRRRFEGTVGYSPVTLARVLRLQRFLRLAGGGDGLAGLAAQAGYADQPHLTRDSTALTGLAPAALLATGAGPAGERLTPA